MKRPLESATSASPFPVSQRLRGRFLLYGNVCVDCAFQVASFPIFGLVCPTNCGGKGTNIVVVGCQASFFQWSGLFEEFKLMPRSRTIIDEICMYFVIFFCRFSCFALRLVPLGSVSLADDRSVTLVWSLISRSWNSLLMEVGPLHHQNSFNSRESIGIVFMSEVAFRKDALSPASCHR